MNKSFTKPSLVNSLTATVIALATLMVIILLQSCKKDPVPDNDVTFLSVVQTSPTSATYNFYLNQNRINNSGALSFGVNTAYTQLKSGNYNAKLTVESNTAAIINKPITLEKNKIYSLFVIDKGDKLDYLQVNDDLKAPATDKAFIRFINLSPNAPALNLSVKDGSALVSDKAYKAVGDFIEVEAKVYQLEIKNKETGQLLAEMKDTDLKKGKIYTIVAGGMLNPGNLERAFKGITITNK